MCVHTRTRVRVYVSEYYVCVCVCVCVGKYRVCACRLVIYRSFLHNKLHNLNRPSLFNLSSFWINFLFNFACSAKLSWSRWWKESSLISIVSNHPFGIGFLTVMLIVCSSSFIDTTSLRSVKAWGSLTMIPTTWKWQNIHVLTTQNKELTHS